MFKIHNEINLILMMAPEKSQEKSTKRELQIYVNCPCNVLLLVRVKRSLNVYRIFVKHTSS